MSAFQETTAAAGRLSGVTNQRPVTAHNSLLGMFFGFSPAGDTAGPTGARRRRRRSCRPAGDNAMKVVIVGAGFGGLETATCLSETLA